MANQNFNEFLLDLDSINIAGICTKPQQKPRILAMHGWLDNAASFIPLLPYLQDFEVVAIDLPGHGHSSHIPNGTYFHFIDYVADIIKILDYLNWDNCYLLGHSLGAGIGTIIAGTIPERILGLILLDGIGAVTIPAQELPAHVRNATNEYLRLADKKKRYFADINEAIATRLNASPMQVDSVRLLVQRGIKNTEYGLTWRTDPRLLLTPLVLPTEEQLQAFIKEVTAPTCLIRADNGYPFDKTILQKRIDSFKNITIHTIPGQHHVHMDSPEPIGNIVNNFLNK